MPFKIIREDITRVYADAIVNTANPYPVVGGGTDRAIYEAAGRMELLAERQRIGEIAPGEVAATPAFGLHAQFILHTVGPAWWGGGHGEFEKLASCYRKSLLLAEQLRCESIAFPLISTGVYGFPKDRALAIAMEEIARFLENSEMLVILVVFDRKAYELSSSLVRGVEKYIDDRYVAERKEAEYGSGGLEDDRRRRLNAPVRARKVWPIEPENDRGSRETDGYVFSVSDARWNSFTYAAAAEPPESADETFAAEEALADWEAEEGAAGKSPEPPKETFAEAKQRAARKKLFGTAKERKRSLSEIMDHVGESFQARLLRLIDECGLTDEEVYKKANVDRKLFSKIRCNSDYTPKKARRSPLPSRWS